MYNLQASAWSNFFNFHFVLCDHGLSYARFQFYSCNFPLCHQWYPFHVFATTSSCNPPQHGSKEFTSHGTDHNEHSERGLQRYSLFATIRRHVLYKKTHNSYNNALCGQLFIVLLLLKALTLLCMHVASVWDNGEQFHPRKKNPLP